MRRLAHLSRSSFQETALLLIHRGGFIALFTMSKHLRSQHRRRRQGAKAGSSVANRIFRPKTALSGLNCFSSPCFQIGRTTHPEPEVTLVAAMEFKRQDTLATEIWELYNKTKTQLPNQERMTAMGLKRRAREQARYVLLMDIGVCGSCTAHEQLIENFHVQIGAKKTPYHRRNSSTSKVRGSLSHICGRSDELGPLHPALIRCVSIGNIHI